MCISWYGAKRGLRMASVPSAFFACTEVVDKRRVDLYGCLHWLVTWSNNNDLYQKLMNIN